MPRTSRRDAICLQNTPHGLAHDLRPTRVAGSAVGCQPFRGAEYHIPHARAPPPDDEGGNHASASQIRMLRSTSSRRQLWLKYREYRPRFEDIATPNTSALLAMYMASREHSAVEGHPLSAPGSSWTAHRLHAERFIIRSYAGRPHVRERASRDALALAAHRCTRRRVGSGLPGTCDTCRPRRSGDACAREGRAAGINGVHVYRPGLADMLPASLGLIRNRLGGEHVGCH